MLLFHGSQKKIDRINWIFLERRSLMLKMIEVVGVSPVGFSEAVKEGVEHVLQTGERVHFFQVMEQRGAVREGKLKEFQVVLRVAVDYPV
jgi:flavin-binding protein dodecin